MKQVIILCLGTFIFTACNKDKFQTKPQIKIESQNYDFVPRGQDLKITMSFTDKEGDVDDSLFLVRERLNFRGLRSDTFHFPVPAFPNKESGEIVLTLNYRDALTSNLPSIIINGIAEPDTLALKFSLHDQRKNASDTATANVIVER